MASPLIARAKSCSMSRIFLCLEQRRFNRREAIHRYVEPDKFKKHMLAACEPYVKKEYIRPDEGCKGTKGPELELHPLDVIISKELTDDIKKSGFVLFLQYNYTPFQADRVYKNTITKLDCKFHPFNNRIFKEAFRRLGHLDKVENLFCTRNALVTGPLDRIPPCIQALKKMYQLVLLAGFVDGHLYDADRIKLFAEYANIEQARAQLLATLSTSASDLSTILQLHSEKLSKKSEDQG